MKTKIVTLHVRKDTSLLKVMADLSEFRLNFTGRLRFRKHCFSVVLGH